MSCPAVIRSALGGGGGGAASMSAAPSIPVVAAATGVEARRPQCGQDREFNERRRPSATAALQLERRQRGMTARCRKADAQLAAHADQVNGICSRLRRNGPHPRRDRAEDVAKVVK